MPNKDNFTRKNGTSIPPYTNRGVTSPPQNLINEATLPFFDWYEGRITSGFDYVFNKICTSFNGQFDDIKDSRKGQRVKFRQRGWQHAIEFLNKNHCILNLSYGGQNSCHGIFFRTTGQNAKSIANKLQKSFLNENSKSLLVSRVDVAIDMRGDFRKISGTVLRFRDDFKSVNTLGDWTVENDPNGKTLYLHMTNNVFIRIYEKGKEQRVKGEDENAPLDWVRFELQVKKPEGSNAKMFSWVMAQQSAIDVLSGFKQPVSLLNALGYTQLSHVPIKTTRKAKMSDFDTKTSNLLNQYGNHLQELLFNERKFKKLILDSLPDISPNSPIHLIHEPDESGLNQYLYGAFKNYHKEVPFYLMEFLYSEIATQDYEGNKNIKLYKSNSSSEQSL
jgi:hypothetical protein